MPHTSHLNVERAGIEGGVHWHDVRIKIGVDRHAITLGSILGLTLCIGVLLMFPWDGPGWNAPLFMDGMDCSEAHICRLPPNTQRPWGDAAGNTFEVTSNAVGFRGPEPSRFGRCRLCYRSDHL